MSFLGCLTGLLSCLQAINDCGQSIANWLDRKLERRKTLRRVQRSCRNQRGNRMLLGLIDLAISTLEAAAWVNDLPVSGLPVQAEPRPLTQAPKLALAEGRKHRHRPCLSYPYQEARAS